MYTDSKIVMVGCAEFGWFLTKSLLEEGIKFDHFVSLTPEQAYRNNVSGYRDFSDIATEYGIPIYYPETYSLKAPKDLAFFIENQFDLLVQGGWQRLFPDELLETLSIGAVGVHGSADFLPKGRGRSPLNWSLIEGRNRFIMQLFLVQPGIDDGPIIAHEQFDINEFDDIRTLYYKNMIVTKRMLLAKLPKLLDGTIQMVPQEGIASHFPKRTPQDGYIDWEELDVWQIYNAVRAQTRPYPGAYAEIRGEQFYIWRAYVFDTRITYPDAKYGEIVEQFDDVIIINCRGGLLLVKEWEQKSV